MLESTTSSLQRIELEDDDPSQTREWFDALDSVYWRAGSERAAFLLSSLTRRVSDHGIALNERPSSPYRNTIPPEKQPPFPGGLELEGRITAIMRWNALAMVMRANQAAGELGGHIASYASAAEIFEVGFNHFFRARGDDGVGDVVFSQPRSARGVYARAFLEGRLSEGKLKHYRREIGGIGRSSYPHSWLRPNFWQTPTGSMGIGPISAIYQARFLRSRDALPLGTDGFGRSDTRAALRAFFEVDRHHVVIVALSALASRGEIAKGKVVEAICAVQGRHER